MEFFFNLNFKNVVKKYQVLELPISFKDKNQISGLKKELNNWFVAINLWWGGILAWDIKKFFLKDYPLILKISRSKYHILNAFCLGMFYISIDTLKATQAVDLITKYDQRFFVLKLPSDSL